MTDDPKPKRKPGNPNFKPGHQQGFTTGHQKGFTKGKSGNPGGRPVIPVELKELARSYTEKAIKRLAHWMDSDNAPASVKAIEILLDRAWGKAPQTIQGDAENPLVVQHYTDEDRARALAAFIARTKPQPTTDLN